MRKVEKNSQFYEKHDRHMWAAHRIALCPALWLTVVVDSLSVFKHLKLHR